MTESANFPTEQRKAEWWVLLNCWYWPVDLPHKPDLRFGHDLREQVQGAQKMLDAVGVDMGLVDEIWRDNDRRCALLVANDD